MDKSPSSPVLVSNPHHHNNHHHQNRRIVRNCRNNRNCLVSKFLKTKYNNNSNFYHHQNNSNNLNNNNNNNQNRIILTRSQSSKIQYNNNINNNVKNKQYNNINNNRNNDNCVDNCQLNGIRRSYSVTDPVVIVDEESAIKLAGNWAKEVYNWVICRHLENKINNIPADSIIPLLNDMQLYPSPAQVLKMVRSAKQCSRPNARDDFLTFGELCVFARALKSSQLSSQSNITSSSPSSASSSSTTTANNCQNGSTSSGGGGNKSKCEVFLGGSCNPTTWRADTAIPALQRNGISFYNPQVSMWAPELVAQEHDAKQAASVLLFVIDSQTRSTVGMIEVAYLVASGRCVVVVVQPYQEGQTIMGETITDREFHDLVSCQKALLSLVRTKGVKIHRNLSTALDCTAKVLRRSPSPDEVLRKLREDYDAFGGDINNLLNSGSDKLSMNGICNHIRSLNGNITSPRLSFSHFCTLMSEFNATNNGTSNNSANCNAGCNNAPTAQDGWANVYQRQHSANNNSNHHHITSPLSPTSAAPMQSLDNTFHIFLGGSLSTLTNWRQQVAIPLLKQHGLSYYNPAMRETPTTTNNNFTMDVEEENDNDHDENSVCEEERKIGQWKEIMDRSEVLLFVITNDTRSMTSLVLAAHYIGLKKKVVLSIEHLPDDCRIANETLSRNAIKDYNRARVYVTDLAQRNNLPVFNNIQEAVESAIITFKL